MELVPLRRAPTQARRPAQPAPMKLTERDSRLLEAVHAFDGVLGDYQSRIVSNIVDIDNGFQILGGGVYSYYGNLTIEESEISNNVNDSQVGDGGGIGIIAGMATITRSDIRNNSTTRDGGGVSMLFNSSGIVNMSCIVGNDR